MKKWLRKIWIKIRGAFAADKTQKYGYSGYGGKLDWFARWIVGLADARMLLWKGKAEADEVQARADRTRKLTKAECASTSARLKREASERREAFWARIFREAGEFWQGFCAMRADKRSQKHAFWIERWSKRLMSFHERLDHWEMFWKEFFHARADKYERKQKAKADCAYITQEAKAKKWAEFRKVIVTVFRTIRVEFSRTAMRMRRSMRQNPQTPRNFTAKVTRKFSLLLALGFVALTFVGIIYGSAWINAFAPVGVVWSLGLPVLIRKNFFARIGQAIILFPTCLWMGVWLVYRLRG